MTPKREQPTEEAPAPEAELPPGPTGEPGPAGVTGPAPVVAGEGEVVVILRVKLNGFPIGVPVALLDNDELRAAIENGLAELA